MKHVEYAYTIGMADSAVEERLRTTETGVLSLARENDSYAFPMAHYYDGERLYFRVGETEESKKREYLATTETACYVLYGTDDTEESRDTESWSVVVTGRLAELPESERGRFDTAEINRRFAPVPVFDQDVEEIEVVVLELEIDAATGRRTPEA